MHGIGNFWTSGFFQEVKLSDDATVVKGIIESLHLEQNGEENKWKIVDEEEFGEDWFCPVYGWKLWIKEDSGGP